MNPELTPPTSNDNQAQPASNQEPIQQRSSEKVIQPLDPTLTVTAPPVAPQEVSATVASVYPSPTSMYDPSGHNIPSAQNSSKRADENNIIRVAVKHKSLMVLAIVGLLSVLFGAFSALALNEQIQRAPADVNTSSAKFGLGVLCISIVVNFLIYTYFLLAKNPHTVATILKILLILELINVFGAFWGVANLKGVSLVVDGISALYIYIVYTLVKTPPAI